MIWQDGEKQENFTWNKWIDRNRLLCNWIGNDIKSIIDLGAGGMVLKKMLPDEIIYYPVDYIARFPETIVADFNHHEFPNIKADCCFGGGILEYIEDTEWFVQKINETGCNYVLLSYCIKMPNQSVEDRRNRAWVNDLTFQEIQELFYRHGFILTDWNKYYDFSPLLRFERATPRNLTKNYFCTGCGACASICSCNALFMHENEDGFLKPKFNSDYCVNCGKCLSACHILNKRNINSISPKAYAIQAPDEIRKDSSSGGAFSLLANEIFARKGIVFGAVWTENFLVQHRFIEYERELPLLMHSKYMQSNIGNSYVLAKEFLEKGKLVLFSGTPCQVAGLYSFLNEEYPNLITVDLLCHYVPSPKYFKRYLNENFGEDTVVSFTFRDKQHGWNCDSMRIELEHGESIIRNYQNDRFQQGFHFRLFMNEVCSECKYADIPRVGDITIGDAWVLRNSPEWDDGKGISQILVNTHKGNELYQSIISKSKKHGEISLESVYDNRIKKKYAPHPAEEYFKELISNYSFNESVDRALGMKFSIGLVGDWAVENYGANITYFALYSVLHDQLGQSVLMIERPQSAPWKPKEPPTLFFELPYPEYAIAPYAKTKAELFKFNENCSSFVLGSDQIWNNDLYHAFGECTDLNWVNNDHLKIAYATSFGSDYIRGTEADRIKMKYFLQKFDAVSVREQSGVDILRDSYDIDGTCVLDPVFLCEIEKYLELAKKGGYYELKKETYIFSYMLDINEEKTEFLKTLQQYLKKELILVTDAAKDETVESSKWDLDLKTGLWLEEWLAHIICSDCVITDSFHGMCFAVIFHKPFIAIVNEARGATRFHSLLHMLGLENHLASSTNEALAKINLLKNESIDWSRVDTILIREKEHSIHWLKDVLKIQIEHREKTSYDLLAPSVAAHDEHINYIDNFSYIDVLPSQSASGKRTRLALGDQILLFQVFNQQGELEKDLSIASQQELVFLKKQISDINEIQKTYESKLEQDLSEINQKLEMEKRKLVELENLIEKTAEENKQIKNSHSYKIGKAVTWLPRIIRKFVKRK